MRCLVTGGAGFIGSNLALELEKKGNEVVVMDNLLTGAKSNLNGFKGKILEMDVSRCRKKTGRIETAEIDKAGIEETGRIDVIFHQAAITNPRFKDDKEMLRANVEGFKNMICLAKRNNARLVYASTANLYGNGPLPMKENQKPEIISTYGKSKLMMDELASGYFDKMEIVGLRYFNVFGPGESNKGRAASMVYHLSNQIRAGKRPRLFRYGEQKRDHIYIKDVVEATIKAGNAASGVYNVGTGRATTFNELVKILNNILGKELEPEYFDCPYDAKTYQSNTQADTTIAEKELNFKAQYTLKEGIKEYIGWLKRAEWIKET